MKLNRLELKKIIYDFNSISNRLLQADYDDYTNIMKKFISFIKSTPIIYEYITACGTCELDLDIEFNEIGSSYGRLIFELGDTDEEEIRNIFSILNYIAERNKQVHLGVAWGYSSSTKYQDKIKGFNDRVVMVLINHIERYLTKIGIDMGIDEKITYSISVQNGQVNIASDNASITATNTIGADIKLLKELIQDVQKNADGLSPDDAEILKSNLEVVEEEVKSEKPRKGFLKTAVSGLKMLKGTAEFAAAITALIEFIQPLL